MRKIPIVKENMEEIMRLMQKSPGPVWMIHDTVVYTIPRINRGWVWNE